MTSTYTNLQSRGNSLFLRYRNGRDDVLEKISSDDYRPRFWVPQPEKSDITDLRGYHNLKQVETDSIEDFREITKIQRSANSGLIFGMENLPVQYIQQMFPQRTEMQKNNIRKFIVDIETSDKGDFPDWNNPVVPIRAISLIDSYTQEIHAFYCGGWSKEDSKDLTAEELERVVLHSATDENNLLSQFLWFWRNSTPDICSGWNSDGFDFPYIYARAELLLGESNAKRLSPWGMINWKKFTNRYGKEQEEVEFFGISHLDYLQLYIKHTLKMRDSYKLDNIAFVELGDRKVDWHAEAATLDELYEKNPQRYLDYNIKDVLIVERLDKKLRLFDLVADVAYLAGVNYNDTFSPVKVWDALIYDHLMKKGVIIPMTKSTDWSEDSSTGTPTGKFEGAYVKDPKMGLHGWMIGFDYTSLYPSIIRQWNLGVDTIVNQLSTTDKTIESVFGKRLVEEYLSDDQTIPNVLHQFCVDNGVCIAMNGTMYGNNKDSFLRSIMGTLFDERKRSKGVSKNAKKQLVEIETELKARGVSL